MYIHIYKLRCWRAGGTFLRIHSVYVSVCCMVFPGKNTKTHTHTQTRLNFYSERTRDRERVRMRMHANDVHSCHVWRTNTHTHINVILEAWSHTIQLWCDRNDQVYDYKQLLRNFMSLCRCSWTQTEPSVLWMYFSIQLHRFSIQQHLHLLEYKNFYWHIDHFAAESYTRTHEYALGWVLIIHKIQNDI